MGTLNSRRLRLEQTSVDAMDDALVLNAVEARSADAVLTTNCVGQILSANMVQPTGIALIRSNFIRQHTCRLFGFREDELIGCNINVIIPACVSSTQSTEG